MHKKYNNILKNITELCNLYFELNTKKARIDYEKAIIVQRIKQVRNKIRLSNKSIHTVRISDR